MEIIKEIEKIPTKGDQPLQTVKVKKMEVLTGDQLKDRSRAS
jgi:hypothetical protein